MLVFQKNNVVSILLVKVFSHRFTYSIDRAVSCCNNNGFVRHAHATWIPFAQRCTAIGMLLVQSQVSKI